MRVAGHVTGLADDDLVAAPRAILAGRAAAAAAGRPTTAPASPPPHAARRAEAVDAALAAPRARPALSRPGGRKQFVCVCEDVTVKELEQGDRRGLRRPRDAEALQHGHDGPVPGQDVPRPRRPGPRRRSPARSPAETGLTTARPPFQPVTLAALAGPAPRRPIRRTAMHERHEAARRDAGSTWATGSGRSTTATSPPSAGPSTRRAGHHRRQHARQARRPGRGRRRRSSTGSTPTGSATSRSGRVRYRAMLDDAGIILDDGTVARLGDGPVLRLDDDGHPRRRGPVAALVAGRPAARRRR